MRFAEPYFALTLLLILLLSAFYFWAFRLRRRSLERFADKQLLKELLRGVDFRKKIIKCLLIIFSVGLMLIALMRPQWGFHWQEVKRKGLDIIIALDTSNSMLAEDIRPSRLERSKLAIRDMLKDLKGDRVGLIAFAGSAFLECPLTADYGGFLLSLDDSDASTIPRGGTAISGAIKEALRSYEGGLKKYKVLIIITDGEDHEGDPVKLAEEANKEGIIIFCIGIGTKEGELIPVRDESGQKVFLKDANGNVVKSRLDETVLQKIALATGGTYLRATSAEFGLNLLYKERLSRMEKRALESKMSRHYEERYQIVLGLALLVLVVELCISDTKR